MSGSKKQQINDLKARLKRCGHLMQPMEYKYCTELLKDLQEEVKQMSAGVQSRLFSLMNENQRAKAQSWKGGVAK